MVDDSVIVKLSLNSVGGPYVTTSGAVERQPYVTTSSGAAPPDSDNRRAPKTVAPLFSQPVAG